MPGTPVVTVRTSGVGDRWHGAKVGSGKKWSITVSEVARCSVGLPGAAGTCDRVVASPWCT